MAAATVALIAWFAFRPSARPDPGPVPLLAADRPAAPAPAERVRQISHAVPIAQQMQGKTGIVPLVATDDGWQPARLEARRGGRVRIHVKNGGQRPHNLVIPAFRIYSRTLQPGEENYIEFTADRGGEFAFFSNAPGAVESGLKGTLAVGD